MSDHIMPTYASLPIRFTRGQGAWLWDDQGRKYLDALSGIAVCGLGHAHPAVAEAICQQARTLIHTSNLYRIDKQEQLADRLCALTGMDNVFFANSGAESNEAAIKISRRFAHAKGIGNPLVISFQNSFHGRTLATLTATGNPKVKEGFSPLPAGFLHLPYDDLEAVQSAAREHDNIVAILVEPVQGEGGVRIPDPEYLAALRALCDEHDWLLMVDEIQTGMGRTGQFLGCQHSNVQPDVLTLAKALANGVPIGACLTHGKAAALLTAGSHGSTFGGNPLACSAALAVLDVLQQDDLIARATQLGARMQQGFEQRLASLPEVSNIRHLGLMIGIELNRDCSGLVRQALERGLLINVTAGNVIRLLPPLVISDDEADQIVNGVSALLLGQ